MGLTNLRLVLSYLTSVQGQNNLAVFSRQEEISPYRFSCPHLPSRIVYIDIPGIVVSTGKRHQIIYGGEPWMHEAFVGADIFLSG